ncbi:hypothetical protein [Fictibacillus fluitans]|uniref:Uncharacterized protein n=1 Tax=Fictibacillus fluitans TaxID=3058422 RepID=A0ABT8HTW1_9BACL|nr:hypothetical protein [Fictibacillus sp. NE201]MDN4524164.1 hypothetical protein [Fictibacillus sp. NE201]
MSLFCLRLRLMPEAVQNNILHKMVLVHIFRELAIQKHERGEAVVRTVVLVAAIAFVLGVAYFSFAGVQPSTYKNSNGKQVVKGSDLWRQVSYRITERKGKPHKWHMVTENGYANTEEKAATIRYLNRFKTHVEHTGYLEAAIHIVAAICAAGGLIAFMYRKSIKPQSMQLIKGAIGFALLATFYIGSLNWNNMSSRAEDITEAAAEHARK